MTETLRPALAELADAVASHELVIDSTWYPPEIALTGQAWIEQVAVTRYETTHSYTEYAVDAMIRCRVAQTLDEPVSEVLMGLMDPAEGIPAVVHADRTLNGSVVHVQVQSARIIDLFDAVDGSRYVAVEFEVGLLITTAI